MNTIQSEWETYQEISRSIEKRNRERFAFYAGAIAAFDILLHASDLQEDIAARILDGIYEECQDFIKNEINQRGERNERSQNGVPHRRG